MVMELKHWFRALLVASIVAGHGNAQILLPIGASSGHGSCRSWKYSVDTNSTLKWDVIPMECEDYVAEYMGGGHYLEDMVVVVQEAWKYAQALNLTAKNAIWIFDVDETSLSNLPYYVQHRFGSLPYNSTAMKEWFEKGTAPALATTLWLYKNVVSIGIKPVLICGRSSDVWNSTISNMNNAGFDYWEKIVLKDSSYADKKTSYFKATERAKLVREGYSIVGNIGDQWSDISGDCSGDRGFKLPNPMYYVY